MNGMTLHGGIIPYSGTFLVFSDYARPAIRLAALMHTRAIHVMTHDSIGLGEDGPTHQPVEHFAALRAIPNLHFFRPADAVEVVECWQLALETAHGPSVLALTRQNTPQLSKDFLSINRCAAGAYEIVAAKGNAQVSIFASGSEVAIAIDGAKLLASVRRKRAVQGTLQEIRNHRRSGRRGGVDQVEIAVMPGHSRSKNGVFQTPMCRASASYYLRQRSGGRSAPAMTGN